MWVASTVVLGGMSVEKALQGKHSFRQERVWRREMVRPLWESTAFQHCRRMGSSAFYFLCLARRSPKGCWVPPLLGSPCKKRASIPPAGWIEQEAGSWEQGEEAAAVSQASPHAGSSPRPEAPAGRGALAQVAFAEYGLYSQVWLRAALTH